MEAHQVLLVSGLILYGIWAAYMATFRTADWNRMQENTWQRNRDMAGGLGKVLTMGLSAYLGRRR